MSCPICGENAARCPHTYKEMVCHIQAKEDKLREESNEELYRIALQEIAKAYAPADWKYCEACMAKASIARKALIGE